MKFLIPMMAEGVSNYGLMRYPARWLLPSVLIFSLVRAGDVPAPVMSTTSDKPTAATPVLALSTTNPSVAANSEKPVPVTKLVDLFNGKDLSGWSYFVKGQPTDITSAVQIKEGGVLSVSNKPSGYIVVDPARENYQLHVEYRWTNPNPPANTNSGVLLHISPGALDKGVNPLSFQFQTKITHAGDIISMSTATCAEAAAGATASRQKDSSEKPAGEWNLCDIIVRGDTIECSVNGVTQNKVTKCVPSSGKIGFQLEGFAYELRNLKLAPLEPVKPAAAPAKSN